ncbi:DUF5331 domain-containing protein [Thermoleptolyngbya sp. C42_A2020_037]|uniref:DUF5331 domain-containing protein n=1 Tax=Thermoleptolyngbya sp. C42_A2020_037 TaxID=2747799 RepID=UPI0019D98CAF|nr:DUF5331 domain-containing protein [Thermoleptolyngbya sp. C42_A2020_037]MBF2083220.1 hypothetical protein [Thermoleptolyngbya sp. C42_A2020_037]
MNVQYLRKSLKIAWLTYYRENRAWIARLGVWVDCAGQRRPSSGFILGTLSTLEPQLTSLLPLIVDLSNDPDRIILALGLNFNPDDELDELDDDAPKMLPSRTLASETPLDLPETKPASKVPAVRLSSKIDEACTGVGERD